MATTVIHDPDELRALVGQPAPRARDKDRPALVDVHRGFLARSPLVMIATCDSAGRMDVSPKGDPPGFVAVLDERRIAIPERPGNKRMDGFLNVLDNPRVGTLWLVPGRGDTLRINGSARIVREADYFDEMTVRGHRPILALEVEVEQVYFHCAKAFMRSKAWQPDTWDIDGMPSVAEISKALNPQTDLAELRAYYEDPAYAAGIYTQR